MKLFGLTAVVALSAAIGIGPVLAQDAATVIKARKAQMQLHGFNLGPLGAMAKGDIPYDAALASSAAHNLALLTSTDFSRLFAAGTGRPENEGTRALAAIWENPDDFAAKVDGLRTAAAAMADAAGTDLAALQGAMGPLGSACGACHKDYRAEE